MSRIRTLVFLALCIPMLTFAADVPPQLEPLPEPPEAPEEYAPDAAAEPQVTIIKRGEETIEEYRVNGELYMQKITPSHGVSYYLVKETVDGGWSRLDGPGERIAVPNWVLFRF